MKTRYRINYLAGLLSMLMVFAGCATVVKGTTQRISISSDPPGAKVTVDDISAGETPTSIELSCASSHTVKIEKAGYLPHEETLSQTTSGMVAGNILAGGLIGMCVDAASGGMYNLTPESVSAKLLKAAGPAESHATKPEASPAGSSPAAASIPGVATRTANPE